MRFWIRICEFCNKLRSKAFFAQFRVDGVLRSPNAAVFKYFVQKYSAFLA